MDELEPGRRRRPRLFSGRRSPSRARGSASLLRAACGSLPRGPAHPQLPGHHGGGPAGGDDAVGGLPPVFIGVLGGTHSRFFRPCTGCYPIPPCDGILPMRVRKNDTGKNTLATGSAPAAFCVSSPARRCRCPAPRYPSPPRRLRLSCSRRR